ncbi:calmodulin-binding transcription activator 4-like isoform X1 [Vigna umbellata]|uniref:calmodulin-binding transcription activator 4-like isoform X1 n=1 Tax=Vigna umbellata TaxID=87088 RepID=UPI001F5FCFB8|nr:calmodulin-binding transcription activator 4-like isoform X1 [Vigna umbellata]XP_047159408.1 calmodulin-binding transcription activator 4-like isoform X1 [Vigna umbellata]XP_047159409.1 calmodulin-binding transcription activator 4-like isoform X1 [Vigna umbellata]
MIMVGLEYNIDDLFEEAKKRWLKPVEVLYILRNHDMCELTHQPPHQPAGGSLYLFNRRVTRYFRKDGHNWRKKKDGRTVGEAHERLKVGNEEILNCYYAHGEENRSFQRRSYWMLEPKYEHIVLVHYSETSKGKSNSQLSSGSSLAFSQSQSPYAAHEPGTSSIFVDSYELNHNFSSPPGSLEVTSEAQALRQLEEELNTNEDSFNERVIYKDKSTILSLPNDQGPLRYNGRQDNSDTYCHDFPDDYPDGNEKTICWTEVLEACKPLPVTNIPDQYGYEAFENEQSLFYSGRDMIANMENNRWPNSNCNNVENSVFALPQGDSGVKFPLCSRVENPVTTSDYYGTFFDQTQIQEPLGVDSSLTVERKQKFTIRTVSPECCYATETTKVVIIGSFLYHHPDSTWACMFGDVEVPAKIIQDGVISCETPSNLRGKVKLCITSGNRVPCSEVIEFEFRNKATSCTRCNSLETEDGRSPEDLLLLVRFAEMLHSSTKKDDSTESGSHLSTEQKDGDDSWSHMIDTLLVGSGKSSDTVNWLLEELLKDKLQLWLSNRCYERDEGTDCSLSKKEQGIIHMISGLGFEWALNPILSCGVNINFRDINGWTALHWAAKFGREKMVASLIASGASAEAVTDPSSQNPSGETAASVAASHGHKGLAGYLSEVHLTSHLSSLTLTASKISEGSSELEAELTVSNVSEENIVASEDQVSLKASLDAVRNATQAAARIQDAFRAHSFRKRKAREAAAAAAAAACLDGYCIDPCCNNDNMSVLSAMSKLSSRSLGDYNLAALSIQKKYRGWKGRKEFLALRQKVVKIQAIVRGYQARKQYKILLWAVGILNKVVLRWRRKRVGITSVRQEMDSNEEESDDEDFLNAFRKEKVNGAIQMALKRVLSMVRHEDARHQYRRLLSLYRQAKTERDSTSDEAPSSTSEEDPLNMEDDDWDLLWQKLCA